MIALSGLAVITLSVAAARRGPRQVLTAAATASVTLILIPWLLVFNNHNEIHYWFEYRSLPIVLGVGVMAFCAATRSPSAVSA